MEPSRVFAYGTLAVPELMRALTGSTHPRAPARLDGYVRRRVRGACYPGVAPAAGSATLGVVYSGVDAQALALLDRFEGPLYERVALEVRDERGAALRAFAYRIRPEHRARLAEEDWSEARFRSRHLREYLGHCADLRRAGAGTLPADGLAPGEDA